jgi:hypothetical protein
MREHEGALRMICRLSTIASATALLVLVSAPPARSAFITYDLTGEWTGTIKCKELVGGVKQKSTAAPTMTVSQLGVNFLVQLDFGGGNTQTYGGLANPDAKKPELKGEAILIRCGTNDVLGTSLTDTMARIAVAVSKKPEVAKASFKGFSFFSDPSAPDPHHGTCKWKFTRQNKNDPGLQTSCAISGVRTRGGK